MKTFLRNFVICCFMVFAYIFSFAESEDQSIQPLPLESHFEDYEKIQLGQQLFSDPRLSSDNMVSCQSCHNLVHGGMDGLPQSIGIRGQKGGINAPSIFNSGFNFRQFWNGRAKSLEDQVDGPINNPKEMGSSWEIIITKLNKDQDYVSRFKKIYGSEIKKENIADAIANFERALTTPNSRFDRFLRGETEALSQVEKTGYGRFKSYGCVSCHQGINVGGNMFQSMGVMGNYFAQRGTPLTDADLGRFAVTRKESDKFVFRVPSLRNVEITAPYFHDGSAKTLAEAVDVMATFQLGQKLSREEIDSIVAFLKTLTGESPAILKRGP